MNRKAIPNLVTAVRFVLTAALLFPVAPGIRTNNVIERPNREIRSRTPVGY